MTQPPGEAAVPSPARERLLARVIDELDRGGLGERSLRELAAAAGTSHRMLIHHFGSREGLLVAVVEAVEAAERERAVALHSAAHDPGADPFEVMRATWKRLTQRSFAGRERLFFECYARGLQGEAPFDRLLPAAVNDWLDGLSGASATAELSRAEARAVTRLGLAVTRGLLLDLLATGDRKGTTAAYERFLDLLRLPSHGGAK